MDRDTLLTILKGAPTPETALFQYCVFCGKDPELSAKFVNLLHVGGRIQIALGIACALYGINLLRDSTGRIIQYL